MAAIVKNAVVTGVSGSTLKYRDANGTEQSQEVVNMAIVLGQGTPGEQRPSFMVLQEDFDSLGRPTVGTHITVTITA